MNKKANKNISMNYNRKLKRELDLNSIKVRCKNKFGGICLDKWKLYSSFQLFFNSGKNGNFIPGSRKWKYPFRESQGYYYHGCLCVFMAKLHHGGFVVISQCPIVNFKSHLKNDLMYLKNRVFGLHYSITGRSDWLVDCMSWL